MQDSIFTKIIKREIPSYTLYEDEKTMAFLDINPARLGHTLVVTKAQVDQFIDLNDEEYTALWQTVKLVAGRLRDVMKTERVAVKIIGTDVSHVHVHLLPFNGDENPYHDDTSPKLTDEAFRELCDKLKF